MFFQVIWQPDLCQRLRVGPMVAGEAQDDRGRVEEVRPRPQPDERGGGSFEGKSACSLESSSLFRCLVITVGLLVVTQQFNG